MIFYNLARISNSSCFGLQALKDPTTISRDQKNITGPSPGHWSIELVLHPPWIPSGKHTITIEHGHRNS